MPGQPPTVETGERASPGSVNGRHKQRVATGAPRGTTWKLNLPNLLLWARLLNASDPGLARGYAEGQVYETLAATLPSHNLSQCRSGPCYETSPYGREYIVQVSHESAVEHPTPFRLVHICVWIEQHCTT